MSMIGQPVPLQISVFDASGVAADPGGISLVVTKPDGTATTYLVAALTHVSTGVYRLDYVPVVAGLHGVQWTATGANATAPAADSFHVEPSSLPPLISLSDARRYIGRSAIGSATDADIAAVVQVASTLAELVTGKSWRRREVTETLQPVNGRMWTTYGNVISVTAIDGSAPDASTVGPTGVGVIYTGRGGPTEVVYVAGPEDGVVPPNIAEGVREMVRWLWPARAYGPGAAGRDRGGEDPSGGYIAGYLVPYRVQQLWLMGEAAGIA